MWISKTLQNLIDGVRFTTNHDTDTQIVDLTQLMPLINEEMRGLWSLVARMHKDTFTNVSAGFAVTGGTHTIGSGTSSAITDFLELRKLEVQVGDKWMTVRPWRLVDREYMGRLSYKLAGKILQLEPASDSDGTYRLWYIHTPVVTIALGGSGSAFTAAADSVLLPFGGDKYVIEGVAARVQPRFKTDPTPHLNAQAAALATMRLHLVPRGEAAPARDLLGVEYEGSPFEGNW